MRTGSARVPGVRGVLAGRARRGRTDLLVVIALALGTGALAATVDAPALRIAAGVALELLLTGYAVAALASARTRPGLADVALRTLGASLVVAALGGLLLDVLPGREGRVAWSLLLVGVTVTAAGVAWLRSEPAGRAHRFRPRVPRARTALNLLCALAALAIATGAVALAAHSAKRASGFTELSALPSSSGRDPSLVLRVRSHEPRAARYLLTVSEDGRRVGDRTLRLRPGREWRVGTASVGAATRRVVISLYRLGASHRLLYATFYPPAPRAGRRASERHRRRSRDGRGRATQVRGRATQVRGRATQVRGR